MNLMLEILVRGSKRSSLPGVLAKRFKERPKRQSYSLRNAVHISSSWRGHDRHSIQLQDDIPDHSTGVAGCNLRLELMESEMLGGSDIVKLRIELIPPVPTSALF